MTPPLNVASAPVPLPDGIDLNEMNPFKSMYDIVLMTKKGEGDMKNTIVVMSWITVLVVGLVAFTAWFYVDQSAKATTARDQHIRDLGLACIHHVHNLQSPADAYKNSYTSMGIDNVGAYVADAVTDCLQRYPLYGEQAHFSGFNTTLD